jgi:D-inositol-3-phosphate glycosyltransferase
MHIALVHRDLHRLTRGGICTVYRALADEFVARGHEVTLITQESPVPIDDGRLRLVSLPRQDDLVAHGRLVSRAIEQYQPDVAECSSWEFELFDYVRRPADRRVPVIARGDLTACTMGAPDLAAGERAFLRGADGVMAVSRFAATDIAGAYGVSSIVVPNGVDRRKFSAADPSPHLRSGFRVWLDADGRVVRRKQLGTEADAAPDPYGLLAGPGLSLAAPARILWVGKLTQMKGWDRLERLVRRLRGVARFVILIGHGHVHYPVSIGDERHVCFLQDVADDDLPALYRSSDYLLSTSRWEGFGLAIAEALACGVPALLPDQLGVASELLEAGVTGECYADDGDLVEIVRSGRRFTPRLPDRFCWSANATATLRLYDRLLATRARSAGTGQQCGSW